MIHSSRKRKGLVGERRELVQAPEACVCGEGRVLLRVRLHVGASVRSRSRSCRGWPRRAKGGGYTPQQAGVV